MTTLIVIAIMWWVAVRLVQLAGKLWRLADAEIYPRIGGIAAAQD